MWPLSAAYLGLNSSESDEVGRRSARCAPSLSSGANKEAAATLVGSQTSLELLGAAGSRPASQPDGRVIGALSLSRSLACSQPESRLGAKTTKLKGARFGFGLRAGDRKLKISRARACRSLARPVGRSAGRRRPSSVCVVLVLALEHARLLARFYVYVASQSAGWLARWTANSLVGFVPTACWLPGSCFARKPNTRPAAPMNRGRETERDTNRKRKRETHGLTNKRSSWQICPRAPLILWPNCVPLPASGLSIWPQILFVSSRAEFNKLLTAVNQPVQNGQDECANSTP